MHREIRMVRRASRGKDRAMNVGDKALGNSGSSGGGEGVTKKRQVRKGGGK